MGGLWKSKSVADPLFAKDVVLIGGEKPGNLGDWCWVHPGAEKLLLEAIEKVLVKTP